MQRQELKNVIQLRLRSWLADTSILDSALSKDLSQAGVARRGECNNQRHVLLSDARDETQTTTPLSSRPIRSKTAFVSTLVPNMSSGRLDPSPRTPEFIHFFAATASFSNRERASSYTAINATKRSLSPALSRFNDVVPVSYTHLTLPTIYSV